jgi:hypothetical protein
MTELLWALFIGSLTYAVFRALCGIVERGTRKFPEGREAKMAEDKKCRVIDFEDYTKGE